MIRELGFRCRRSALAVVLAVLLGGAVLPSSSLASTTFGADLSQTPNNGFNCGSACTLINTALPAGAPVPVASPVTGTIIRWRIKTDTGSNGTVTFRLIAPAGGGMFTGAGTGDTETTPTTATTTTFSTQLPIRAGDYVGVDSSPGKFLEAFSAQAGPNLALFSPTLADGGPPASPNNNFVNNELLVDADVAALPSSSVSVPACSDTGQLAATVTSDPDPAVAPKAIHFRIDGGSQQVLATTGNPGSATIAVPSGSHTLQYWGEDTVGGLESPHHTASVQVGGCATTTPTGTSPTQTSPTQTSACQDPTGAYNQGFNAGFNSGFNTGFHAGFNAGFHAGFQQGFHDGFGSRTRHGTAASGAPAIRAQAIPTECNPQFNQGFNTAFNVGFNSGFQRGFNSGFTSGFKSGFNNGHRARHHR